MIRMRRSCHWRHAFLRKRSAKREHFPGTVWSMPWTILLFILNMDINASTARRLPHFAITWDDYSVVTGMLIVAASEVAMRKLLNAAAERAMRYLEGLNERGVAP